MIYQEQQLFFFFFILFDDHTHGQGPGGGQVSQVNNLAGEEAVGHAAVLAYVLCIRDAGKYAKPEVDPQHYHLSITLTLLFLYLPSVFFWLNAKNKIKYKLFI